MADNKFTSPETLARFPLLPRSRREAVGAARASEFIAQAVPAAVAAEYFKG